MTAPYNFSNLTASNTTSGIFQFSNNATGGVFGWFLLLIIWGTLFVAFKRYPTKQALSGATFLTTLFAFMLKTLDIVPDLAIYVLIASTAACLVGLLMENTN